MRSRASRRVPLVTVAIALAALAAGCGDGPTDATAPPATGAPTTGTGSPTSGSDTTAGPGEPVATTTTVPLDPCPAREWTSRQRLGQLVMVGVDPSGPEGARRAVVDEGAGGIFIGGNDTGLLAGGTLPDLVGADGVEPFVAIDDEGGRVQRLDALEGDLPSARELAATAPLEEITRLAAARGEAMVRSGVNVDFAPVLDVSDQAAGEVIGDRSFGNDPATVTRNARAFAAGLRQAGVLPVYKHFPGHGHADGDSHQGTSTTPALDQLGPDLEPFRTLLPEDPVAAVMVGHLVVPGLTGDQPASLSPEAVTGLLRTDLGYDGLVFTDDLGGMRAISDRLGGPEAVRQALTAGVDVALLAQPASLGPVLDLLEASVADGSLPATRVEAAFSHVMAAKGYDCTP